MVSSTWGFESPWAGMSNLRLELQLNRSQSILCVSTVSVAPPFRDCARGRTGGVTRTAPLFSCRFDFSLPVPRPQFSRGSSGVHRQRALAFRDMGTQQPPLRRVAALQAPRQVSENSYRQPAETPVATVRQANSLHAVCHPLEYGRCVTSLGLPDHLLRAESGDLQGRLMGARCCEHSQIDAETIGTWQQAVLEHSSELARN